MSPQNEDIAVATKDLQASKQNFTIEYEGEVGEFL